MRLEEVDKIQRFIFRHI